MKCGDLTFGEIEALINKLGGTDGVRRFLAGELVVRTRTAEERFPIWKTIKLATFGTPGELRGALKSGNFLRTGSYGSYADDILGKLMVATEGTDVDLVLLTVENLGFKNGATRECIYRRAKELGLELCPAEVGPQLRLQYMNQRREWLIIGMDPITSSDDHLRVFVVAHSAIGMWLGSDSGRPDEFWLADNRWVFVRPRRSTAKCYRCTCAHQAQNP